MKVVILCGGMGTRLKEETEYRPKPMVKIGNKPILWHLMNIFAYHGFKEFILCLGHKGEMIKEYFFNFGILNNDFTINLSHPHEIEIHKSICNDWLVTLADTGERTLKEGRLKKIEKYIDGDMFLATYGDSIGNIDIPALVRFHKNHGKIATISGVTPASRFGIMKIENSQVRSFHEKPQTTESIANGGFMAFNRKIFDYLNEDTKYDMEYGTFEQLAKEGQLMMFRHKGFWAGMDTIRDTEYLNELWYSGNAGWLFE